MSGWAEQAGLTMTRAGKMKVLLFSTLYPSAARPIHGIFVETRLRELMKSGQVDARVVAPVPWFPLKHDRFGEYAKFAKTPGFETRNGIDVSHPRYFLPPKVGMNVAPYLLAVGAFRTLMNLRNEGFDFDLIDAHYYYPDGVAAMMLARWFNKPFVVTARGTDLNLIPDFDFPRRLILKAANAAAASIGVCQALTDRLHGLGATPSKLHVMRNGVDLERFRVMDRAQTRHRLNLPSDLVLLLSVGNLVELKGHHLAIEALNRLPANVRLAIAGAGVEKQALQALAAKLGVSERVIWAGALPQSELVDWYNAADALTLCSSREGWANVLLESMACGTPVIATNIPGTREVVCAPQAGILMQERSAHALVEAYARLMSSKPDRNAVRRHAESFSWDATTRAQLELFSQVIA